MRCYPHLACDRNINVHHTIYQPTLAGECTICSVSYNISTRFGRRMYDLLGILQYINPLGQAHARFVRYLTIYPQDPTSKCRVRPQSCKRISTLYPILHALPKLTLILHAVTRGCVIPHRLRRPQAPIRTYHGKSFFLTWDSALLDQRQERRHKLAHACHISPPEEVEGCIALASHSFFPSLSFTKNDSCLASRSTGRKCDAQTLQRQSSWKFPQRSPLRGTGDSGKGKAGFDKGIVKLDGLQVKFGI